MIGSGNFEKFTRGSKKSFDDDYRKDNPFKKKNKKNARRERRLEKENSHWESLEKKDD